MTAMDTTFRTAPGGPPTLRKLVVIGNGMAGARTVEEILARDGAQQFAITMFGDEPYGNYNRIMLSHVLAGEEEAALLRRPGRHPCTGAARCAAFRPRSRRPHVR